MSQSDDRSAVTEPTSAPDAGSAPEPTPGVAGDTAETTTAPEATTPAAPVTPAAPTTHTGGPTLPGGKPTQVRRTRFSVLWTTVIIAALVLILLLIFILQNNNSVPITFLGWTGHLPLGVAMLFAAIAGVLLVAIPGYGRILQLRRAVRKAGTGGKRRAR